VCLGLLAVTALATENRTSLLSSPLLSLYTRR
jgi:hypothetical protein